MAKRKPASKATKKKPTKAAKPQACNTLDSDPVEADSHFWRVLSPEEAAAFRKSTRVAIRPPKGAHGYDWQQVIANLDRIHDEMDAAACSPANPKLTAEVAEYYRLHALRALEHSGRLRLAINAGDMAVALRAAFALIANYMSCGGTLNWDDIIKGRKAVDRGPRAAAVKSAKTDEVREWVRREYAATLTLDNDKANARKRVIKAFPIKFPKKKVPADSTIEEYVRTPRKARRK